MTVQLIYANTAENRAILGIADEFSPAAESCFGDPSKPFVIHDKRMDYFEFVGRDAIEPCDRVILFAATVLANELREALASRNVH